MSCNKLSQSSIRFLHQASIFSIQSNHRHNTQHVVTRTHRQTRHKHNVVSMLYCMLAVTYCLHYILLAATYCLQLYTTCITYCLQLHIACSCILFAATYCLQLVTYYLQLHTTCSYILQTVVQNTTRYSQDCF